MNVLFVRLVAFLTQPIAAAGFLFGLVAGRFKSGIHRYNLWAEDAEAVLIDFDEANGDDDGGR